MKPTIRAWLDIIVTILVAATLTLTALSSAQLDWFDAFMCFTLGVTIHDLTGLFFGPDPTD